MQTKTRKRKPPRVLTENKLITAGHHLAKSREQLSNHIIDLMDAFAGLNNRLHTFEKFMDARDDLLASRMQLHSNVVDMLGSLKDVLTENTVALNENTDRLEKFLTKFETYFGTDRGLELDN
jgi:ABC-type transporter Mla subunit MlaD